MSQPTASPPLLYDLTLVSPWFELTRDGSKLYEGRLAKRALSYREGDIFRVRHASDAKQKCFYSRILSVQKFVSFEEGLTSSPNMLKEALPTVATLEAGIKIYHEFYSPEEQKSYGIVFIRTERVGEESVKNTTPAVRKVSLWLQANEGSEAYLKQSHAIQKLSQRYSQPSFAPHVTLASFSWPGTSNWSLDDIVKALKKAASCSVTGQFEAFASHPTNPWMVLFMMLKRDGSLMALRQAVWDHVVTPISQANSAAATASVSSPSSSSSSATAVTETPSLPKAWPFVPHLSLVYDIHDQISPVQRLYEIQQDCSLTAADGEFDPQMTYEFDRITLVHIDTDEYSLYWKTLASVSLPKDKLLSNIPSIPESIVPQADDIDAFKSRVLSSLDISRWMKLTRELSEDASEKQRQNPQNGGEEQMVASILVSDNQIVACGVGSSTTATKQLLCSTNFARLILERVCSSILFTIIAPSVSLRETLYSAGIRVVFYSKGSDATLLFLPAPSSDSAPSK